MTDELKQWEYDKGYTKGYSDGRASLIEELEKIKEEFGEYSRYTAGNDLVVDWENIEEVFKDRISELKGE